MKFGKRMLEEMLPQWRDHYVNYKRFKQFINNSELHGNEFSNELFSIISEEMGRAEKLFAELLDELQNWYDALLEMNVELKKVDYPYSKEFTKKRRCRPASPNTTASPTNGSFGEGPTLVEATNNSSVYDIDGDDARKQTSCLAILKRFFLFAIGDSQRKELFDADTPRGQFLDWNSKAHQLQHFVELNVEAIRKTAKKLRKYRRMEADYGAAIESEIARSNLTTAMPRLHNLMSCVSAEYERKFNTPLDPYANIDMTQEWHAKWRYVLLAVALFYLCLWVPILDDYPAAHKCVALFVLVIVMWITEAIPFFCTAMFIPVVAVPLGILKDPASGKTASATVASQIILGKIFHHVQVLVMGGLTIGKAFSRTNLEQYAASFLHKYTGHRPAMYLLGVMVGSCLICAFVSNVAAPLLVLGVIQRTLWEFPEGTKAPHGILLGLAIACNLGGMLSPIASPQNAFAMTVLSFHNVSFAMWVGVAIPVVAVTLIVAWVLILLTWKPFNGVPYIPLQVVNATVDRQVSTADRMVVVAVSALTILLWILPPTLLFGDTAVVALIPIVVFFGIGILSKEDFNTLSWHLLFLLAGGSMLGLCAQDSEMLDVMAGGMKEILLTAPPYMTLVVVIALVGLVTTFVSHTVAAMILLPIVAKIGFLMPPSTGMLTVTPQSMVVLSALMCSGAMAFPISSFPNVNSLLAEDAKGRPYLQAKDFLFAGTVVQLFFTVCLFTWMVPITNMILG